jgi:hypothetical protein
MESLYEFFVRENPTSHPSDYRVAIEAFEALLPDKAWRPSNPKYGGFFPIIETGIAAHFLKGVL